MNVRLVGPKAPMSGRLEIYIQDQWGSACLSNSNGEKKFGYLEASVVCRSLDFKRAARNPYDLERFVQRVYFVPHVHKIVSPTDLGTGLHMGRTALKHY